MAPPMPTRTLTPPSGRPVTVPVRQGPQRQGAVGVVPVGMVAGRYPSAGPGSPVPAEGIVVPGGHEGGPCRLLADGTVTWDPLREVDADGGVFTVGPDAVAYLVQPEGTPLACAPGSYLIVHHEMPMDRGLHLRGVWRRPGADHHVL